MKIIYTITPITLSLSKGSRKKKVANDSAEVAEDGGPDMFEQAGVAAE